jgi:urea transport system substrate-binding protein
MAEVSECPDLQHLMRLVLGKVSPEEATQLSRHLLTCRTCLDTLHSVKAEDTLIRQLQAQAAAADPPVQDLLDSVIRRLQEPAASPPQSSGGAVTAAYTVTETPRPAEESYDFLLAPQEPNELGRLGAYRIVKMLGSGGMGLVLQAEDVHLQRFVALKVLRPQLAKEAAARQRFLREARAAAALKHDNIVTIYQVGEENGIPYLAMEFLEGETLETRLEREGRLRLVEVLRIGREIASGLAAAHERNLIHRDIKPPNIWLEGPPVAPRPGERRVGGRVKILDFGLARPAGGDVRLTAAGLVLGTPQYMAPEQARNEPLDPRCDLFSLGAVLYRTCTGQEAFVGDSTMALLTALAVQEPKPLTDLDPDLPPGLVDLVKALLAKKRDDRPPSARAVVEAIRALEYGEGPPEDIASAITIGRRLPAPGRRSRRRWLLGSAAALVLLAGVVFAGWYWSRNRAAGGAAARPEGPPIKVGVLHSRTGTMAISEKSVIDATLLAIDMVNEEGGVLGRPVEAVVEDGCSDWPTFAQKATKLITQDNVCTIFGCWTSASRKTVKEVVEKHNHLLFYPVQYEGLEQSPNIVYLGAAPNQQLIPAVKWCCTYQKKRKLFLVGSDYVFPHAAHAIIRDQASTLGGEVVGEEYLLLGSPATPGLIEKIQASQPDVILNTINGDSNVTFFRALRAAGLTSDRVPTISFSITEEELGSLSTRELVGDYAAWTYFQSIDRPQNQEFVRRFQARYGPERVTTDPMEAAYCGVHLWAQAVAAAGTAEAGAIREAVKGLSFEAPQGRIRIDPETQHCSKFIRIGRIGATGRFEVVYASEGPIQPVPYPSTRSRAAWEEMLTDLHLRWGGQWANPGKE